MRIAMSEGKIKIIEADVTQTAIINSWGKMKYLRSQRMYEAPVDAELLNRLAKIVHLPPKLEEMRLGMNRIQAAVDAERVKEKPEPMVKYPVTKNLYEHQVRAANMALMTFGMIEVKEVT